MNHLRDTLRRIEKLPPDPLFDSARALRRTLDDYEAEIERMEAVREAAKEGHREAK